MMVALCAAWGLQSVAIKFAMAEAPPIFQAAVRSIGASLLVLFWARLRGQNLFSRDGSLWPGLWAGVLFGVEFLLLYSGLNYTSASRAILFLYTSPFVVALGVHLLVPGEQLDRIQAVGLVCAFSGVAVVFADGLSLPTYDQMFGDALILLAAVFWGATTILIRASRLSVIPASKTLFYQLAVSALILPPASLLVGESWPQAPLDLAPVTWLAIVYQVVGIAFISYFCWFWLIGRYPAGRLAAFSFLTPLFGIIAGALLLDEPVTLKLLAAFLLVALGIRLVNRTSCKRRTDRKEAAPLEEERSSSSGASS